MTLKLIRFKQNKTTTLGKLFINDLFFCYTLEDVTRNEKIKNETAIPKGVYKVVLMQSNKFQRVLPLVYNQPGFIVKMNGMEFKGIRIHGGNDHEDTSGCILVAANIDEINFKIWGSMEAELTKKLKNKKNIELIITNKFNNDGKF